MNTIEIENGVLGYLILTPSKFFEIERLTSPELFTSLKNIEIYNQVVSQYATKKKIDSKLLVLEVSKTHKITYEEIRQDYLIGTNTTSVYEYIDILTNNAKKRRIQEVVNNVGDQLLTDYDPNDILSYAQNEFVDILKESDNSSTGHISDCFKEAFDAIHRASESKGLSGVNTGFQKLNDITGGWQSTDLVIVGARPGLGKTTMGLNYAISCVKEGKACVIYSLEMSVTQLLNSIIAIETDITTEQMRTGKMTPEEIATYQKTAELFQELPLFVYDDKRTVNEVVNSLRYLNRKYNIEFCMIDYLQLMESGRNKRNASANEEVEYMSRKLKLVAGRSDANCCVMALSQLSRSLESRSDKRPLLSDLRQSGAIEQDADIVIFLYRDSYYDRSDDPSVELILAKNRHGSTGMIPLEFRNRLFVQKDYWLNDKYKK